MSVEDDQNATTSRFPEIIRSIKTPIGLLALVVLVAYAILAVLVLKVDGSDFAPLLWAMSIVLGLTLLAFTIVVVFRPEVVITGLRAAPDVIEEEDIIPAARGERWEIFISSPMSSFANNQSYADHRRDIMQVVAALRRDCGFSKVYCASERFEFIDDFEAQNIAFDKDSRALRNSDRFLMIYPSSLASSVLVEAGMALALHKPSVYWVATSAKLPFMLEQAGQVKASRVTVYSYTDVSEIVRHFRINKGAAFDESE